MPPHGHHGHHGGGGHGHHGGGGWGGPMGPTWYPQPAYDPVVVTAESENDRILRYIASLPPSQRAQAFQKFFGTTMPGNVAGIDYGGLRSSGHQGLGDVSTLLPLAGIAIAIYFLFIRKR